MTRGIHDELVLEVPEEDRAEAVEFAEKLHQSASTKTDYHLSKDDLVRAERTLNCLLTEVDLPQWQEFDLAHAISSVRAARIHLFPS